MKGFHKGQLITAVSVDPNNQMYPIAYAVVEAETRKTWYWFLENLQFDLQLHNSHGVAWITDKQNGLIDAISELFPLLENVRNGVVGLKFFLFLNIKQNRIQYHVARYNKLLI